MIDVLAGAVKLAEADATLVAMFPAAARTFYLDAVPESVTVYPRAVVRHVTTTWKRGKESGATSRYDSTTFKFEVYGDDLPTLNRIQLRLQALFDKGTAFTLIASDGTTVAASTAAMASCNEAPGGTIQSLPQPNTQVKSIHRLDIRFKAEVTRHT